MAVVIIGNPSADISGQWLASTAIQPPTPAGDNTIQYAGTGKWLVTASGGIDGEVLTRVAGAVNWATAAGGIDGHVIEDEATPLAQRAALNFIGAGVTVTDNAGLDASDVTIPGGATTFLGLTDTPANYTGEAGSLVRVNQVPDGLEFVAGAKGDTIPHDGATWKPIAVGTDGQVYTADAASPSGLKWADAAGALTGWETTGSEPNADFQPTVGNTAGQLFTDDGTAALPALAGKANPTSGLAFIGGIIQFSVLGTGRWSFDNDGLLPVDTTRPSLRDRAATSTIPTIIPQSQVNTTGLGNAGGDTISLITGSVESGRVALNQIQMPLGTAGTPGMSFLGSTDLGFFRAATNVLGVAITGLELFRFSTSEFASGSANGAALRQANATATVPSLVPRKTDSDTGIGWAAVNELAIIAGGTNNIRVGLNLLGFYGVAAVARAATSGTTTLSDLLQILDDLGLVLHTP